MCHCKSEKVPRLEAILEVSRYMPSFNLTQSLKYCLRSCFCFKPRLQMSFSLSVTLLQEGEFLKNEGAGLPFTPGRLVLMMVLASHSTASLSRLSLSSLNPNFPNPLRFDINRKRCSLHSRFYYYYFFLTVTSFCPFSLFPEK